MQVLSITWICGETNWIEICGWSMFQKENSTCFGPEPKKKPVWCFQPRDCHPKSWINSMSSCSCVNSGGNSYNNKYGSKKTWNGPENQQNLQFIRKLTRILPVLLLLQIAPQCALGEPKNSSPSLASKGSATQRLRGWREMVFPLPSWWDPQWVVDLHRPRSFRFGSGPNKFHPGEINIEETFEYSV